MSNNQKEQTDSLLQSNSHIEWDSAQTEAGANNQNNPHEVPQVKSAEQIINDSYLTSGIPDEFDLDACRQEAIRCCEDYAAQFKTRIAELQKQNAVYREGLENIASATDGNNPGHAVFYFEARNTLTLAEQALKETEL